MTQVQALSLAKECVINKMELLTNAGVVDDAMKFVSEYSNKISKKENSSEEFKEPDYDDEDTELEEEQIEQKQEEETGEIATTINHVF